MPMDVIGLGNALIDALVVIEDEALCERLQLTKGTMHPVDDATWNRVFNEVKHLKVTIDAGGSCANAIAIAGLLGADVNYCGRVGDDDLGRVYAARMIDACGKHALQVTPGKPTGKSLALISAKDAERTMLTDLGAAITLPELDRFLPLIENSKISHFTGYTLFEPLVAAAVETSMQRARASGSLVSLDAADPVVIKFQRDLLWSLIERYADIVFLNAEEAQMLTGVSPEESAWQIASRMQNPGVVVVKIGRDGSLVLHEGTLHRIDAFLVPPVDTTGAGDSYAGSFLFGISRGWTPSVAGRFASAIASLVVQQVGARLKDRAAVQALIEKYGPR